MIVDTLLSAAESSGASAAVADPHRSLDFTNLVRFACVMRRHVEKATSAPNVGLMLPSTCAFAGTFYGILWAGRTAVPLNFLLQPAELAAVVRDAGIEIVFTIRHFRSLAEALPVKAVYLEKLPLRRDMLLQRARSTPPAPIVQDDDVAVLLYTSGTSGAPKGVCQTYRNLTADVTAAVEKAKLDRDHRFLGILPLFHSFGLTTMLLVPVALRASVYYLPRFQPRAMIETIRDRKISVTMMIASMYAALLRAKDGVKDDLASLQYAVAGGEALPDTIFQQFRERFGVEIIQGYGMTEAGPVVSLNVPWSNRVGTVGQAVPGVCVSAFDDDGHSLPSGQVGELWIKGPIIMKGYYNNPQETELVLNADGWYKSGDMGMVDHEGYITITGRKKEMIIVGGENVYPREVESVLEDHPAVHDAAVIGQPDTSRGEVVVAFVTLREGKSATEIELREFCRDRIAGYKQPRRVIIAEDFPRGPTGKILKRELTVLL